MVEDDSDSDAGSDALANANTTQLIRTCGATFGPNGEQAII
jgi:hypothetical protein